MTRVRIWENSELPGWFSWLLRVTDHERSSPDGSKVVLKLGSKVGVGMGLAWGWHGVGMGLAWGWHGVSMGLA
jgi:hypothetical protein